MNARLLIQPTGHRVCKLRLPALLCGLLILTCEMCVAQAPLQLSKSAVENLVRDGDRLADQGDFQGALENYTQAYLGVVSEIRGQPFAKKVPPTIYNREQLGHEMLRMMQEEYTDEELNLMDSAYKVFGLVQPEVDCRQLVTQLLTEEVAGFYDPDTKRMVLIVEPGSIEDPGWLGRLLGARPAFDKDEQKTTLSHELTHALQDQLYDLNAMEAGIAKDDDMLTAFSALVEGDATLLMFAEMDREQDITQMDPVAMRATFNIMSWMLPLAGGETYRKAPPIFRDSLIFPYFQGMLFVLTAAGEGGWPRVHQLYSDPPVSTEQILHPAKYFDNQQRDVPQVVKIPELAELLNNWTYLGGNVLGELQTGILLKRVAGARAAAAGWDGDRYEVFQRGDGKLGLVFVSIWDSDKDAQEFAQAYKLYRQPKPSAQTTGKAVPATVFADDSTFHVQTNQDQVWVVEGFNEAQAEQIIQRLSECSFTPKTFIRSSPEEANVPDRDQPD